MQDANRNRVGLGESAVHFSYGAFDTMRASNRVVADHDAK